MAQPPLACTVRDCGRPLSRRGRTWSCPRGHSYDVARSGYVNLLQPQDRRSPDAGDAKTAVESRSRLIEAGLGRRVLDQVTARLAAAGLPPDPVVVDLGSGSGELLAMLAAKQTINGVGIDLSTAAIEHAARRFAAITWVVANADRRLPLVDASVDAVVSLHGRRNPAEAARVLKPRALLLLAVPAPDDLIELRELVLGQRVERERAETVIAAHADRFTLRERSRTHQRAALDREQLLDLLRSTYRGGRRSAADRVQSLAALDVTLSSDLLVFEPAAPTPDER